MHLAIGMFDGVHRGHQAVLAALQETARANDGLAAVLTFTPHPTRVLRPDQPTLLMMNPALKIRMLFFYGVDAVIEQPFDAAFSQMAAEDFPALLKRHIPGLKSIHIGDNFRFGKGRSGTVETLAEKAAPLGVEVTPTVSILDDKEPISSTRIRGLLAQGRMEEANALLGHLYTTMGEVVTGRQLGRTMGFPTLNFIPGVECSPRYGVYAVTVCDPSTGDTRTGIANYGLRPTVQAKGDVPVLEVHLLGDECPWTTGDYLCVFGWTFLRSEKKFPMLSMLQAQIAKDKRQAEAFFATQGKFPPY